MGEIATEYADRVILTDDNPRDEAQCKNFIGMFIGQLEKGQLYRYSKTAPTRLYTRSIRQERRRDGIDRGKRPRDLSGIQWRERIIFRQKYHRKGLIRGKK
jgi:hypothetical protein